MRAVLLKAIIGVAAATQSIIALAAGDDTALPDAARVQFYWDVRIPLRDGIRLSANVYIPQSQREPAPCIVTLTPYIAQTYHERGVYFAAHGFPFVAVDVRGRGNSEGEFRPLLQESQDGYDVVEWIAKQPYCSGQVAMWGGSYAGYDQWATARAFPPHLATIVPVAAAYAGVDFPMSGNVFYTYDVQWLLLTDGRAFQDKIFGDDAFWTSTYRRWFESGAAFKSLDSLVGAPSPTFQEWLAHPHPDAFWDQYNPTAQQYSRMTLPVLTITGSHDDDQLGALTHYREFMAHASAEERARHYLVIGPWDHAGTRTPNAQFGGLSFGPKSLLDIPKLHLQWYAWTMQGKAAPEFLRRRVAYYVMYADKWRYADSLEAVTDHAQAFRLGSNGQATDVFRVGTLALAGDDSPPDRYVYDPRDIDAAKLEATVDPESLVDQSMIYSAHGKHLIYQTAPFEQDTEISGFFYLSAWIAIDQPDTDFAVGIYEIRQDGGSILLTHDVMRARYRRSLRVPQLIQVKAPLRYSFQQFTFVSQEVKQGSRLRLVLAPINSIRSEKNYNAGGEVAAESIADARSVSVTLYHDRAYPSALYVPFGRPGQPDEVAAPSSAFSSQP
jgi:uncharacterized protein